MMLFAGRKRTCCLISIRSLRTTTSFCLRGQAWLSAWPGSSWDHVSVSGVPQAWCVVRGVEGIALLGVDRREAQVRCGDGELARRAVLRVLIARGLHVGRDALGALVQGGGGDAAGEERESCAGGRQNRGADHCKFPGSIGDLGVR